MAAGIGCFFPSFPAHVLSTRKTEIPAFAGMTPWMWHCIARKAPVIPAKAGISVGSA
jgi:hypothetical protein